MANVFDYLAWRGELTFSQAPFNEVDSLILCILSYIPFDDIVPGPEEFVRNFLGKKSSKSISLERAAEKYFSLHGEEMKIPGLLVPDETVRLLRETAQSGRFKDLELLRYINSIDYQSQKQFAAMTVIIGRNEFYIAYRGTDDTIAGWKEDFNMCYMSPVPSQKESVHYLEETAQALRGKIRLGGHSKGGNLAVYAAAFSRVNIGKRIVMIYNNDGPGFTSDIIRTEQYQRTKSIVRTLVPQSSVVGMLLEHEEEYVIIRNEQNVFFQHNPFTWEVTGASFCLVENITASSKMIDNTVKEFIRSLDDDQKEQFVDALFGILEKTEARTLTDLYLTRTSTFIRSISTLDEKSKQVLKQTLSILVKAAQTTLREKQKLQREQKNKKIITRRLQIEKQEI